MQLNGLPKSGGISLAHGWGGGPVPALSGYILGIRPTAPGYRHWIIAPQPGDLHYAQGQAPTPHGPIDSRWRRGGHFFKLTIAAPRGTSGVVRLPLPRHAHAIAMDGKAVHAKRRRGVAVFKKVRGRHTFVAG
jgi:alpha-L-rhamnosidase